MIRDVVYPQARIVFDASRPDGPPRKLLDVSRLRDLGWTPSLSLRSGIESTYRWFLGHQADARGLVADEARNNVRA
jgi:GDP-L-fucose synthase